MKLQLIVSVNGCLNLAEQNYQTYLTYHYGIITALQNLKVQKFLRLNSLYHYFLRVLRCWKCLLTKAECLCSISQRIYGKLNRHIFSQAAFSAPYKWFIEAIFILYPFWTLVYFNIVVLSTFINMSYVMTVHKCASKS